MTFLLQAMVRLIQLLLTMLRYARDRLLEFCYAPTEAPEELLNSGIGVLTREDGSIYNPESLRIRSEAFQQLQKDKCNPELSPATAKKDDLGMNHGLGGQSEIYCRKDVNIELQGILSKLEVSQDYALLARQVRQEGIYTMETLRSLVSLIFENAVIHPTQCAMYAQLCKLLIEQARAGDFPGGKEITFQSVLLTKCQDEFKKLTKPEQAERDDKKGKQVKLRTLGSIKLIGELFNEKLLPEKVVLACIRELLGQDPKATPVEENVEVLCHLLRSVGKKLDESTKSKMAFDTYFARLKLIRQNVALPSRIQSMVRSVSDLRSKKWVSRQEETKALRKGRPSAPPNLLPGAGGMAPGMSIVPSILGMPGMPVASDFAKEMEFGAGRVAAMPKPKPKTVRDNIGVRANKDNYNLRDLSQRVQMFDK